MGEIDNYYDKVTACINLAINNCIPAEQFKTSGFIVPGWTDYCKKNPKLRRLEIAIDIQASAFYLYFYIRLYP